MTRAALLVLVLVAACSKPAKQGLPPAGDWNAEQGTAPEGSAPALPPGQGEELPPGHPPTDNLPPGHPPPGQTGDSLAQPKTLAKLADGRFSLGPYSIAVPAGWTEVPTKSEMRAGQFKIGDAELVVYYFGETGAGSEQANLDRWLGQFEQADGKASKDVAKIEKLKILGLDATIVTVSGHYKAQGMGGMADADKADQSLFAAITGSTEGPYYWKLVGPKATIASNTGKMRALLTGMKKK